LKYNFQKCGDDITGGGWVTKSRKMNEGTIGIVFVGPCARGYYRITGATVPYYIHDHRYHLMEIRQRYKNKTKKGFDLRIGIGSQDICHRITRLEEKHDADHAFVLSVYNLVYPSIILLFEGLHLKAGYNPKRKVKLA